MEIDDIRWYLAEEESLRLLTYADDPKALGRLIWSGKLESDLYRFEERFLEDLQQGWEDKRLDEAEINKILGRIEESRRNR